MNIITRSEALSKGLTYYFTGKQCKNGHVSPRTTSGAACVECRKDYMKEYNAQNKVILSEKKKEYYQREKGRIKCKNEFRKDEKRLYNSEYYRKNKRRENERAKKWKNENKQHCIEYKTKWDSSNKQRQLDYAHCYRKNNPEQIFIRKCLERVLGKFTDDDNEHELIIGYTSEQLRQHLESQFVEGMSWGNHGDWHIDHIIPISWWLSQGITDPSIINSLDNLQPLWAKDNLIKSNKI